MYFYFFCEFPAVIKFQGVIFGAVNNSVKFCNIESPYPFTEICPLYGESENFAFYPTDEFLNAPPKNVTVTDLKGGYFLRFAKSEKPENFKILAQEKYRDGAITAFVENGCKISLETTTGFFAETLEFLPKSVNFTRGEGVNGDLIFALFLCEDKKILNVYGTNSPALLFSKEIDDYSTDITGFSTTEKLKDIAKHVITCEYSVNGGEIKETSRKVSASENFNRDKLSDLIIPYAFSEEFLCGGDYDFYLAENVKENAEKLGGFFGDFLGVTTPPLFRNYKEVGFIKKVSERKYAVDYFTFDLAENKIININKI